MINIKLHLRKIQGAVMGVFLIMVLAGAVGVSCQCSGLIPNPDYVGTVVDDVTGEPIEGAIALAQWCKRDIEAAMAGVSILEVTRIEEVRSDKEGKVFIDNFWKGAGWLDGGPYYKENKKYPQLTVYKPGYVAWHYRKIFIPRDEKRRLKKEIGYEARKQYTYRIDFGHHNRIIKLEHWSEGYSHYEHGFFIRSSIPNLMPDQMKILKYFEILYGEYDTHEGEKAWKEFNK